jgi:hypothetical protein
MLEALSEEDIPRDIAVNEAKLPTINIVAIVIVTMPNKL